MIEKDEEMKNSVVENVLKKYGENATTLEIMEEAIKRKAILLDFKKPNPNDMLDIEESEKIASDTNLFKKYNLGVENSVAVGSLLSESTDLYEDVIKSEFRGKELVVGFSKKEHGSKYIRYDNYYIYYDVTFLMNITSKDRLHIQTCKSFSLEADYEKNFIDYEKYLDKYDLENSKRYMEYFSDRIPLAEEKEFSYKHKLTSSEKEFLAYICKVYGFSFDLVFKDGVMCIHSNFLHYENYERNIEEISYFIDCMLKIIERFMN